MKTFEEAVIEELAKGDAIPGNTEIRWVAVTTFVREARGFIPRAPKEPRPTINEFGDIALHWFDGSYTFTLVWDMEDGNMYWEARCGRIRLDGDVTRSFEKVRKGMRALWGARGVKVHSNV